MKVTDVRAVIAIGLRGQFGLRGRLVPSLAAPLSKPQDRRPVSRVRRSMLNEPALSLHPPGLKTLSLVFS